MPISTNISRVLFVAIIATAALGGASCDNNLVEGTVETHKGERLPGVVVTVEGTRFQAMSNAQGVYKVRHDGAPVMLRYFKTGYAPGILEPNVAQEGRVEAEPLQLWQLPVSHGVWLYDDYQYTRARPVEPERVLLADGSTTFGVSRLSDVYTDMEIPFIVIFGRLPTYNISLSKLDMVEAPIENLEGQTEIVWIPVRDIPVSARPLDKPEGKLIHVRLFEPLQPGSYAVHWGALKEASPLDPRAYLFNVQGDVPEGVSADTEDATDDAATEQDAGEKP